MLVSYIYVQNYVQDARKVQVKIQENPSTFLTERQRNY